MANNYRKVFTVRDGIQVSGSSLVVANNNVGIGTSAPTKQAEVVGELLISGTLRNTGVVTFRNLEVSGITTFYEFDSKTGYKGLGAGTTNPGTVIGIGTSYAGIQTGATMQVGFGITLFANTGRLEAAAFYGDGSTLSNVPISGWTSTSEAPPSLVAANTTDIYRLANVGIGTTIVTHRLTVKTGNFDGRDIQGDIYIDRHAYFGGIVTASSYRGDISLASGIAQTAGFARTAFFLTNNPTIGITTLNALGAATIAGKLTLTSNRNHLITGAGISITGIVTSRDGFVGNITGTVTGNASGLYNNPDINVSRLYATTAGIGSTNTGIAATTNGAVLIDGRLDAYGNSYNNTWNNPNQTISHHLFLRNPNKKINGTIGLGFGVGLGTTAGGAFVYEQMNALGGDFAIRTRNTTAKATEKFRVTQGGNVGIGSTRPGRRFSVIGNAEVYGASKFVGVVSITSGSDANAILINPSTRAITNLNRISANATAGQVSNFSIANFTNGSAGVAVSIGYWQTGADQDEARVVINPTATTNTKVATYRANLYNAGVTVLDGVVWIGDQGRISITTTTNLNSVVLDLTKYGSINSGISSGIVRLPVISDTLRAGIYTGNNTTGPYAGVGFMHLEEIESVDQISIVYPVFKTNVGLGTTVFGFGAMYNAPAPRAHARWFGFPVAQASDRTKALFARSYTGVTSAMSYYDWGLNKLAYRDNTHWRTIANQYELYALVGVSTNTVNLGTFTGSTIADSTNIKTALQSLETAVETKAASTTVSEIDTNVNDVITLTGIAENTSNLGTFTGTTIADNTNIKTALQSLETAVEARRTFAYRTLAITGDTNQTVSAASYDRVYWTDTFGGNRTLNISNLTDGREVIIFIREQGQTPQDITINASTTTSGYSGVFLAQSRGEDVESQGTSTFELDGTVLVNGIVQVTVVNIGGNFVGSVIGNT